MQAVCRFKFAGGTRREFIEASIATGGGYADFAEIGHRFRCKLATVTVKLAGLSERSDAGTNGQFSS